MNEPVQDLKTLFSDKHHALYINGEIDSQLLMDTLKKMGDWDFDKHPHMELHIKSVGGGCESAFAIYDLLRHTAEVRKFKIHTYGWGEVMSAAVEIFCAGDDRYLNRAGIVMMHKATMDVCDAIQGSMEAWTAHLERMQNRGVDILMNAMKNGKHPPTRKKLERLMDQGDVVLTAPEALEWGLVTELI
jgi:ATP-dependent protease ClpP protease subunit